MQKRITNFLHKQYICTLATIDGKQPWAFACYYKFDPKEIRLIYVTGNVTKHAKLITENPLVSGTIFTPTRHHSFLQGVQFLGVSRQLFDEEAEVARAMYKQDYPHTLVDELSVWEVRLNFVRLIDNSLGLFGKMEWKRGNPKVEDEFRTVQVLKY